MSRVRALLALLILAVCGAGAASHAPAQPAPTDPATAVKIRELLNLTGTMALVQENIARMLDLLAPQMMAMIEGTTHKKPTPEFAKLLKDLMSSEFANRMPELEHQAVDVYARHLTSDDVSAAIAFYRTPAGQKFRTELPAITREMSAAGQAWGASVGQAAAQHAMDKARAEKVPMFQP